ncbi:MAG TPA: hypothetical protein VF006_09565 [Longimicrobium sp.]
MNFHVTLLQSLPDRAPLAVQAQYRLHDGSVRTWPVSVRPRGDAATLEVESGRDMLVPDTRARSLVWHFDTLPTREERQISGVRRVP